MTASASGFRRREDNCFDFLRLFAACAVLIGHSTHHFNVAFLWFQPDSRLWFRDGVALFFVMSGMLIYRSAQRCIEDGRPLTQFYLNRLLRIGPAIWAYLGVVSILLITVGVITLASATTTSVIAWFVSTLVLIPVYNPGAWRDIATGVLNGSLWTIPVEVSFYATVPVLVLLARRFGFGRMCIALFGLAVAGLGAAWYFDVPRSTTMLGKLVGVTFLPYLIFFSVGILLAGYWPRVTHRGEAAAVCAVAYLGLRILIPGFNESGSALGYLGTLLWVLPFGYLAVWIGYRGPAVLGRLTRRIGDLSFGTYIWHMVVINAFIYFGLDASFAILPNPLLHLSVLAVSLSIAWVSWTFVERTALRFKPFVSRTTAGMSTSPADTTLSPRTEPKQSSPKVNHEPVRQG